VTFEEFDAVTERIWVQVKRMRDTKGKEYAKTADRFDNFNRLSAKLGLPRNKVWQVYFQKHLDAVESYIENGKAYSSEPILGRIVDLITYLTLLGGMIEEDQKPSVAKVAE
jgi:hypothetical protein